MAFLLVAIIGALVVQPYIIYKFGFSPNIGIDDLEFLPYKDESLFNIIPWKGTFIFVLVLVMSYKLWCCWKSYQNDKEELDLISMNIDDLEVSRKILQFQTETEKMFLDLEKKYPVVEKRAKNAKQMIENDYFNKNFQYELDETRNCWNTNFSTFTMIDFGIDPDTVGEWALTMELQHMEQDFDATITELDDIVEACHE